MNPRDKEDKFVKKISGGAELHKVVNCAGFTMYTIVKDGVELMSANYNDVRRMLKAWGQSQRA